MSRFMKRAVAVLLPIALLTAACSSGDDGDDSGSGSGSEVEEPTVDLVEVGLWDDGPCDESLEPLVIGLQTVFQSPIVSLEDQALALEASAEAFNERGGANGACIEVHTCDDGANLDQAVGCVRELDEAGVVATVNDQGTAGQAEVSAAMAEAGIPRVASNVTSDDWDDQNAYPLDPSGTGGTFMHPAALLAAGAEDVGIVRVDLPEASALVDLISQVYEGDLTFPYDASVPAGTTDYTQFIIGAEDAGVDSISLSLGEQEAIQVIRAAEQLGSELEIGLGLGTFSHQAAAELGDYAEQVVFDSAFPPATFDLPVFEVLRADLAASGEDDLQPDTMRSHSQRSWIGLYALLYMIRESGTTDFTRENIKAMLDSATDVPMLGIFGDENWTPDTDHPGLYKRHGVDHYGVYKFDPDAEAPGGLEGNFVEIAETSFADTLCGSIFGAEEPCP